MNALTSHCITQLSTEGCVRQSFQTQSSIVPFLLKNWKDLRSGTKRKYELAPCLVSGRDSCEMAHLVISFWTWTPSSTSTKLEGVFSTHLGLYRATVLRSQRKKAHRGAYELQLVAQLYMVKGSLLLLKFSTSSSLQKCRAACFLETFLWIDLTRGHVIQAVRFLL